MRTTSESENKAEKTKLSEKSSYRRLSSFSGNETGSAEEVIESLNHILANEFTLFTKTLNYHWNVTGPRFHSLHKFFEEQYRQLLVVMDDVAERIRILGESPVSTLREMRSDNTIIETPGKFMSADKMINDLLAGHQEIQRQIQNAVELKGLDVATEDFLIGLLKAHQKVGWMLKSHLM